MRSLNTVFVVLLFSIFIAISCASAQQENNGNNNTEATTVAPTTTAVPPTTTTTTMSPAVAAAVAGFVLDKPQNVNGSNGAKPSTKDENNNNNKASLQRAPTPISYTIRDGGSPFSVSVDEASSLTDLRRLASAQHEYNLARGGEPTLCPPGATVDGTWGISDPKYNTLEFYNEATKFSPQSVFGKWFSGPRSEVLPMICDGGNAADCEWDKPDRWSPFKGSDAYDSRKVAAVYYPLSNKNQQQQPTPADFKSTRAKSAPKLESELNFCYSFQDPVGCLRGRTVLFLGDSHMLNLAQTLCRMVLKRLPDPQQREQFKSICGPLDVRFTKPMTVVHIKAHNTTIVMLRVRYRLEDQMKIRFDNHAWGPYIEQTAAFVIYNRAMWDLVYKDTNRKVVAAEFSESLKYLARRFKKARIIVKMLQYDQKFMRGCSDPERMREVRDANICGAYLAMEDAAQRNRMRLYRARKLFFGGDSEGARAASGSSSSNGDSLRLDLPEPSGIFDPYWKFSVIDSFGMTRELPYKNATDALGHHYEGTAVESMVQQLLSMMCPQQPQNYTLLFRKFERVAKMSCDRLLYNTSDFRKPSCACNDKLAWAATADSKAWCTSIARSGNWVAFLIDM